MRGRLSRQHEVVTNSAWWTPLAACGCCPSPRKNGEREESRRRRSARQHDGDGGARRAYVMGIHAPDFAGLKIEGIFNRVIVDNQTGNVDKPDRSAIIGCF